MTHAIPDGWVHVQIGLKDAKSILGIFPSVDAAINAVASPGGNAVRKPEDVQIKVLTPAEYDRLILEQE